MLFFGSTQDQGPSPSLLEIQVFRGVRDNVEVVLVLAVKVVVMVRDYLNVSIVMVSHLMLLVSLAIMHPFVEDRQQKHGTPLGHLKPSI